jgi:hypothetical protein
MIGLMVLFCISVTCIPADAAGETGTPTAQLVNDVYDFGTVYEGLDVFQDIAIKNTGDANLEITRINGG